MHVWHIVPQHIILHEKKYFSNLTLAKSNVNTISGPINLIQGFERAIIILPKLKEKSSSGRLLCLRNLLWF